MPAGVSEQKGPEFSTNSGPFAASVRRRVREDVGYTHPLRAAPAFGSPERGAVAALRAATEGLRAAWVRCGYAVGAGFHALPAWNEGLPWCARTKWCAGCARVILCAGWRKRGRRTVGDAGAVGQAKPLRLTQPRHSSEHGASRTPPPTGDSGTQVSASRQTVAQTSQTSAQALGSPERGAVTARSGVTEGLVQRGCGAITLHVNPRRAGVEVGLTRGTGVVRQPTTAHRGRCALRPSCSVQQQTHVVGHPTEGASGTPPPTGFAIV